MVETNVSGVGSIAQQKEPQEDGSQNGALLLDRDWEVFVVRRDKKTGELISLTACCEDALADPCCDDAVVRL